MNKQLFKPIALAVTLALGVGTSFAADNFDMSDLNKNIQPCQDFNGYVNAKWIAANPIPADRSSWGAFDKLSEDSLNTQLEIVENAAKNAPKTVKPGSTGSIEQKIGWYYKSGMDAAAINKAGFDPVKPELAKIDGLKSPKDIVAYLDDSFSRGQGDLFNFGRSADFKHSDMQIAYAFQGGLSLPTKDYYTKTDADSVKLRDEFTAH
nr:M13 family metallopeptidase [Pseudomonadota bacterium]